MQPKPIISINNAINQYIGNYIQNPNNALRDNEELMLKSVKELKKLEMS